MDCDVKITGILKSLSKKWNADNADFQTQMNQIKLIKICVALHLQYMPSNHKKAEINEIAAIPKIFI